MYHEPNFPRIRNDNLNLVSLRSLPSGGRSTPHLYDAQSALDCRVQMQESVTLELLEKLSIMKKEMLDQLTYTKQVETEGVSREQQLRDELQGLLRIIGLMREDVKSLEADVKDKWTRVDVAAKAFKQLEEEHLTNLSDLRSRIARSDQAVLALSERVSQQVEDLKSLKERHRRDVEELQAANSRFEKQSSYVVSELNETIQHLQFKVCKIQEEVNSQLPELERRLMAQQSEIRQDLRNAAKYCEGERSRIEKMFPDLLQNFSRHINQRLDEMEKSLDKSSLIAELTSRLQENEANLHSFRQQVTKTFKAVEDRLDKLDELFESEKNSFDTIREEVRSGFSTTHDTIVDVKSLLEDKLRVTEENLQLEMAQLRNMIVLS